jgi:hypothetical protein
MLPCPKRNMFRVPRGLLASLTLGLLVFGSIAWIAQAAEESQECCMAGDKTPPGELVNKYPPGSLHSPYQDYKKLAKDEELVKQFRLPGCNECHGGTGGGGFCPALSQGV